MTMAFVAFAENRVSKHLIANYLIYLVLKHREPRIVEVSRKCLLVIHTAILNFWFVYSVNQGCCNILVSDLVS